MAGCIALAGGRLDQAVERFTRACGLKGENGRALAGMLIARLEQGERGSSVDEMMERARAAEPAGSLVLLASALWHHARGDELAAREEFRRAAARLHERGAHVWIPFQEQLAHRQGLDMRE
jgi:Tfp pilus assembly protein PilF